VGKTVVVKEGAVTMVVNRGGNLSKAYFMAYLNLIMQAKECTVSCAQQYMLDQFFKGNANHFGQVSYQSFMQAVEDILE
jgi:hypothetical protein